LCIFAYAGLIASSGENYRNYRFAHRNAITALKLKGFTTDSWNITIAEIVLGNSKFVNDDTMEIAGAELIKLERSAVEKREQDWESVQEAQEHIRQIR